MVAKYFDKRHDNVIQAIKNLDCSEEFNALNFQAVKYVDEKGEKRPMYRMTRDGFMFLVMGFTGKKAAKFKERFISLFNKMHSWINQRVKLSSNQHLLNDAIQFVELQRGEKDEHGHARENTLIYMIALGSSKKKWLRVSGYAPDDDIRAHLSESQLELLDEWKRGDVQIRLELSRAWKSIKRYRPFLLGQATAQSGMRRNTMNDYTEIIQFLIFIALLLVAFSLASTL